MPKSVPLTKPLPRTSTLLATTALVSLTALLSLSFPERTESETVRWRGGQSNEWDRNDDNWFVVEDGNIANYLDDDDVEFDDAGIVDKNIEITAGGQNLVEPNSITFDAAGYRIFGGEIDSAQGPGGTVSILVNEDAEIASEMDGNFIITDDGLSDPESDTLILSGNSPDGGVLNIGGVADDSVTVDFSGLWGGNVIVSNGGTLLMSGTIDGNLQGNLGGIVTIDGVSTVTGDVDTNATAFTVAANLDANTFDNNNTTTVASGATLTIAGGAGTLNNLAGATLLTNNGIIDANINSAAGLDLNRTADATIDVTGNVTITDGVASLQGDIGGDLTISGGTVSISNIFDVTGDINLTTSLDIVANTTANQTIVGAGGNLTVSNTLNSPILMSDATATVSVNGIDDAFTEVNGTITATNGTLNLSGDIDGDVNVGALVTYAQTGALDITGTLDLDQSFSVVSPLSAGQIDSAAAFSIGTGDVISTDTMFTNSGGPLTVQSDATLGGNVTNQADADLLGTVTGNVTLSGGTADLAGDIGGALDANAGTVDVVGDLVIGGLLDSEVDIIGDFNITADRVETSALMAVNSGRVLDVADAIVVETTGTLSGAGTVTADVTVQSGGTVNLLSAQNINITSAGNFDSGNTTGSVTITDGTADLSGTYGNLITDAPAVVDIIGTVTVNNLFDSGATTDIEVGEAVNAQSVSVTGDLDVQNGGALNAATNLDIAATGDLTLEAGSTVTGTIDNAGSLTIDLGASYGTGVETITSSGSLVSSGTIDGAVDVTGGTADINGAVGGPTEISGDLTISGAGTAATISGDIGGNLDNQTGDTTDVVTSDGSLDVVGAFTNSGRYVATNTMTAGTVSNSGTLIIEGSLNADNGVLTNNSILIVEDFGSTTNDITSNGQVIIQGAVGGNVTSTGGLARLDAPGGQITGNLTVTGGNAQLGGAIGGNLTTSGAGTMSNTGALTVTGDFDNDADFTVSADLTAGSVTNTGSVTVTSGDDLTSLDGEMANTGGTLTVSGEVSANVTNTGSGTVTVNSGGVIDGTLLSSSGFVDVNGTVTGNLRINNGTANLAGAVNGDLIAQDGILNVDGALTVGGNLQVSADADFDVDASVNVGIVTNNGTFDQSTGTLAIVDLINNGTMTLDGTVDELVGGNGAEILNTLTGNLTILGNAVIDVPIVNNGILTLDSGATLLSAPTGSGTIFSSGTIDDDVTINDPGANFNHNGTITGSLTVDAGTVSIGGQIGNDMILNGGTTTLAAPVTVGGDFINNVIFTVDQDLTAANVINNNTLTVQLGDTLEGTTSFSNTGTLIVDGTAAGPVTNTGDITVNGSVDGSLTSTAGTVDLDGSTTGDVTIAGTTVAQIEGAIGGDLNTEGGTTTFTGDVDVTGTFDNDATVTVGVTVTAGALENGGALTITGAGEVDAAGGATNQGAGSLTVQGTLTADTTNQGTMTVTGTVDGNLTSTLGTLDHNGTTTGSLTVTNGVATVAGTVGADFNVQGGTVEADGPLSVAGELDVDSALDVTAAVTAATANNAGTLTVTTTGSLDAAGGITNAAPGVLTVDGELTGQLSNLGTATIGATGAAQSGIVSSGDLTIDGQAGAVTINGGSLDLAGATSGTVTLRGGTSAISGDIGGDLVVDGGTANTSGAPTVAGTLDVRTAMTVSGSLTAGDTRVTGALTVAGALISPVTNAAGATLQVNGDLTGQVTNAGDAFVSGTVTGDASNTGTLTFQGANGTVDGDITTSSTLNVGAAATATVTGTTTNAGTLNIDGVYDGEIANSGTMALSGTTLQEVDNNSSGSLTIDGAARTEGDVDNRGTMTVGDGFSLTAVQGVETTGTFDVAGTVLGNIEVADGTFTIDPTGEVQGTVSVLSGGTANINGRITDPSAALFAVAPASAALVNDGVSNLAGTISGDVLNQTGGVINVTGASTVTGSVNNFGTFNIDDAFGWGTDFTNDGETTIAAGVTATSGGTFVNTSGGVLNLVGTLDSNLDNAGLVELLGTGSFSGAVTNSGTIRSTTGLSFTGDLTMTGTLDMADGAVGDALVVNGDLDFGTTGRVELDIDLSTGAGGAGYGTSSDYITVSGGAVTGEVVLAFNTVGTEFGDLDPAGIQLFQVDSSQANNYTFTTTGLPENGALLYVVSNNDGTGSTTLISTENPAIGGIAGTVSLTQSLIGSIVNRPSSPFVAGLAQPGDKPCGPGGWSRAVGGNVQADGGVTNDAGRFDLGIDANYYGIQFGGDFGCFAGYFNGWDLAFGAIGGINYGTTQQDIFAFDNDTGQFDPSRRTAVIHNDFTQTYAGVYVAAAKGPWVADLQYRVENTEFDLTTQNVDTTFVGGIGVEDQTFSSDAQTLSGSLSYTFPVDQERGIVLVPTIGFSFTDISTERVEFAGDAFLEIDDSQNRVGFIGGTVARRQVNPNGQSAITYFGTATIYNDFAEGATSTFFFSDDRDPQSSVAENLGLYGEVSAGISYVRLLEPGQLGNARQLNASVRGDARFGDAVTSFGITGQVRIQF